MAQPSDHSDPFAPPQTPCEVQCIHCGESYESWRIEWREADSSASGREGFWCCPTPGCDGVGFGFDIFPVDPKWTDDRGEPMMQFFSDDEEEDALADDPDLEPDFGFSEDEMAAMELEDKDDFDDDDLDDEDSSDATVGEFDTDAFWVDIDALVPRRLGSTPQPPYDSMNSPKGPWSPFNSDDIPF